MKRALKVDGLLGLGSALIFISLHLLQSLLQVFSLTYFLHQSVRAGWAFGVMHRRGRFGLFPSCFTGFTAGEDGKSSSPWTFCRLSFLRFMSYLPLLLVPAFGHRSRLSLSVSPPFGSECLTSFADVMTYYALC